MALIHSGRSSVVVEDPPQSLLDGLRRFRRDGDEGEYENLYSLSFNGKTLVTMPGFVKMVKDLCPGARVKNVRRPLPPPSCDAAMNGIDAGWTKVVSDAVKSDGGIVCIPDVLGEIDMAAAILRAFPHDALLDCGLPMSIVAVPDDDAARTMSSRLQELLPGRDIGRVTTRRYSDADDILVTTYSGLKNIAYQPVGIFIACDLSGTDITPYVESISMIRDAARWGIYSTPLGEKPEDDMILTGLFGSVIASATYADAVKAGTAVPITVCWLPSPEPVAFGRGPFDVLEANAMQENPNFCNMIADIVNSVSSDLGVIVSTNRKVVYDKLAGRVGGLALYTRKMPIAKRRVVRDDIANGIIRRVVATHDVPLTPSHGVMILASCGGRNVAAKHIPWKRKTSPRDRAFIVDFCHDWDVHNGRSGVLDRNDAARIKRYQELGFNILCLESVNQLPFIGG